MDTGGPAFPAPELHPQAVGVTALDFFAAHALAGLLAAEAGCMIPGSPNCDSYEKTAANAYYQAQCMLAQKRRLEAEK